MKFKATPAQNIALHTLQSVGLSVLISFIVGLGQFVALHGLDWTQLASFAAGGFLTSMAMMWKTLSSSPNTMQAIMDTLGEIKDLSAQPPVTIHNNLPAPASVQQVSSSPAEPIQSNATPVQQLAPPPQFMPPFVSPFPYGPSSTFPQMPVVQP